MKRIITLALAVILLLGCFPVPAQAAQTQLGMSAIGSSGYKTMTTSQKMLDMIKVMEGFSATPYRDNSQWTIGFGCSAGPIGSSPTISYVTPEEAEELLLEEMKSYENSVNNYCKKIGKQPNQNQFDALVDFTYNLGAAWTTGSSLDTWLRNPTTDLALVNALGQWVRAGGTLQFSLTQRRIREAIIFLRGEYYLHTKPSAVHNVKTDLTVIPNGSLPYYTSVIYQYDYSTSKASKGNGHAVGYFRLGGTYLDMHVPTRDGYTFAGWKTTKINNSSTSSGEMVTWSTAVQKNLELTAVWVKGDVDVDDGTQPPDGYNPVPSPDDFPFTDVPANAWFRESVELVYEEGYMNGVSDTLFDPDGNMTRGMLVTVLYRMDGSMPVTDDERAAFDDIAGKYYTDAVAWAKANGIVNGVTDRQFDPEAYVTRQDAVTILYRYFVEYAFLSQDPGGKLSGFEDIGKVAGYAVSAMQWAVNMGLVNGSEIEGSLYLRPKDQVTRCEMAAILARSVDQIFGTV